MPAAGRISVNNCWGSSSVTLKPKRVPRLVAVPEVPEEIAREHLSRLVTHRRRGLSRPLPFFEKTSHELGTKLDDGKAAEFWSNQDNTNDWLGVPVTGCQVVDFGETCTPNEICVEAWAGDNGCSRDTCGGAGCVNFIFLA